MHDDLALQEDYTGHRLCCRRMQQVGRPTEGVINITTTAPASVEDELAGRLIQSIAAILAGPYLQQKSA